jgi:hypothetical protein
MYRALAEATMAVHFGYIVFVVGGGFLGWRWPGVLVAHVVATGAGALVVAASLDCPLTYIEDRLRRAAGQEGLPHGFIGTYLEGVLYPRTWRPYMPVVVTGAVVTSWLGAYLLRRVRRTRRGTPTPRSAPATAARAGQGSAPRATPPSAAR